MLSIIQAKAKLPLDYIEEMNKIYNEKTVNKILAGMIEKRYTTLRVNSLKYDIERIKKYFEDKGIEFETIPWYNDALIIKNVGEKELQNLEIYKNGYIYLQSLSSMIPPLVLDPKPGEKVLDLTAAPGSKTTQMASLMKNEGYILANELDKIRCDKLKYNVQVQDAKIVEVVNGRGQDIGNEYNEYFDKVLLDTPCSGEGRFILEEPKTYNSWNTNLVKELVIVQKELFESAYKSLKKNGEMCYSTCTLNKKENEEILNWAIENFEIEIEEIDLKLKDSIKGISKGLNKSIEKSLKIIPNKKQEGFFVAKIKKIG